MCEKTSRRRSSTNSLHLLAEMDLLRGRLESFPDAIVENLRMIEEKQGEIANLSGSDRAS